MIGLIFRRSRLNNSIFVPSTLFIDKKQPPPRRPRIHSSISKHGIELFTTGGRIERGRRRVYLEQGQDRPRKRQSLVRQAQGTLVTPALTFATIVSLLGGVSERENLQGRHRQLPAKHQQRQGGSDREASGGHSQSVRRE